MQEAAQQLSEATAEMAADSAKLRASCQAQVATLEERVASLQQSLQAAQAAPPAHSAASPARASGAARSIGDHGDMLQRVQQLEAANEDLERALVEAHTQGRHGGTPQRSATDSDELLLQARSALADRDAQLGRLHAELKILQGQVRAQAKSSQALQKTCLPTLLEVEDWEFLLVGCRRAGESWVSTTRIKRLASCAISMRRMLI